MEIAVRKKLSLIIVPFLLLGLAAVSFAELSLPAKKQTVLKLYVSAADAFDMWKADSENVKILDCRTPGEYMFVGHAPMAYNIPFLFLDTKWNTEKNKPVMPVNENFVSDVKKKFKTTDTIMIMCRSGARSAAATNLLAKAGFTKVYSITDGFEGDKLKAPGSEKDGKRLVNGWKNASIPWTYKLDPKLVYTN